MKPLRDRAAQWFWCGQPSVTTEDAFTDLDAFLDWLDTNADRIAEASVDYDSEPPLHAMHVETLTAVLRSRT